MSAYKKLNKQDVFVTSYEANKLYSLVGDLDLISYDVDKFLINSSSGDYYISPFDSITGNSGAKINPTLSYKSVYQLYYSNFIDSSEQGERFQSGSFENYLQSSIATGSYKMGYRYLNDEGAVISIPRKHFGTAIKPGSFEFNVSGGAVIPAYSGAYLENLESYIETGSDDNEVGTADDFILNPNSEELIRQGLGVEYVDDGEGNIIISGSDELPQTGSFKVGDIIYPHGLIILTSESVSDSALSHEIEMKWKATQPIYTYNVRCKVKDYEMNFTQNPSAINGKEGLLHNNVTGSDFTPYITSVGLYNDANELLAVAKFGKPIPKTDSTEMSFVVKLDM